MGYSKSGLFSELTSDLIVLQYSDCFRVYRYNYCIMTQECLSIFGPTTPDAHTALKMSYAGKGHPLSLL